MRTTHTILFSCALAGCASLGGLQFEQTVSQQDKIQINAVNRYSFLGMVIHESYVYIAGNKELPNDDLDILFEEQIGNWKVTVKISAVAQSAKDSLSYLYTEDKDSFRGDLRNGLKNVQALLGYIYGQAAPQLDLTLLVVPEPYKYRNVFLALKSFGFTPLTIALRLPLDAPRRDIPTPEWLTMTISTIAHEYSHLYFLEHPYLIANRFSDEVIATAIGTCAVLAVLGEIPDYHEETKQTLRRWQVEQTTPTSLIYQRFPKGIHETLTGAVLADIIVWQTVGETPIQRHEAERKNRLVQLCRDLVQSKQDFALADYVFRPDVQAKEYFLD